MKSARDLEAELVSLRTSLRAPHKGHMSLADIGIGWLKNEFDQTVPAELQGRLGKWRERADKLLSDHPIVSAAAALCIGFTLGQLWRRHHDR